MTDRVDSAPQWLLGRWRLQHAESGVEFLPGTCMEFLEHGQLRYLIPFQGREQVFDLEYQVEGNLLRTDNPNAGHAQAVRFERVKGNLLELDFAGARAWFRRVSVT